MKNSEAKRALLDAGFTIIKSTESFDTYEFDDDIRVCISRRTGKENPHTTREVEQAIRRATNRKEQHERQISRVVAPPGTTSSFKAQVRDIIKVAEPKILRNFDQAIAKIHVKERPVVPPPPPEAPKNTAEEVDDSTSRKFNRNERFTLWRRIAILHDLEGMSFGDIARKFTEEGLRTPNGNDIGVGYVNTAYRSFHELRELLKVPKAEAAAAATSVHVPSKTIPDSLPPYIRGMLEDPKLPTANKVAVLRALHTVPSSVELMLDDPDLTVDQKMAIMGIVMQGKK